MTHTDKELGGIPDSVTRMVGFYMGQLRDHAAALEGVRRARGNGHTLSLEVADRTEAIKKSFQRLTDIHDAALSNGVGDRFLGLVAGHGMPDFAHHGFPAGEVPDWVKGVVRYAMDEWTKVYPAPTSVPFELRPAGGVFRGMSDFDAAVSYAGEVASFFGEHGVAGDVFVVARAPHRRPGRASRWCLRVLGTLYFTVRLRSSRRLKLRQRWIGREVEWKTQALFSRPRPWPP